MQGQRSKGRAAQGRGEGRRVGASEAEEGGGLETWAGLERGANE